MMASKVKCYYYPVGGLVDTMAGHGIAITEGKELEFETYDLEKAKEYALSCSWKRSAGLWKVLLEASSEPSSFTG
jgi:hypothetical protein